jgi:hypothetical protein
MSTERPGKAQVERMLAYYVAHPEMYRAGLHRDGCTCANARLVVASVASDGKTRYVEAHDDGCAWLR